MQNYNIISFLTFLLFIFLLFLSFSCNLTKEDKNNNLLSESKIAEILIEFHLLESKLEHLGLNDDSIEKLYFYLEPQVYEKFGVDSLTYRKSLEYYLDNDDLMLNIYTQVVDSLNLREKENRL